MSGHICGRLPGVNQACRETDWCIAREDMKCDGVDENLWPNAEGRVDWHCCMSISVDILYKCCIYSEYVKFHIA